MSTSGSFYTDGGVYDEADVVGNDNPASTTPSQAPSSFYADGGVAGEGEVISNDTVPSDTPSDTPSSFFKDGGLVGAETVENNDNPASITPSQAPSSFYPNGNVYNEADEAVAETYASNAAASAAAALASENAAAASEAHAASSEANAATSEANADADAAAALASQIAAAASEAHAAASEAVAVASASTATTKAAQAATSAANALTSETNADTSEANAAASAAAAAASAAVAANKVDKGGDTMTGQLNAPTASTALVRAPGLPSNNMTSSFQSTPPGTKAYGADASDEANAPAGGWWFHENYRHSNASNYWGTQVAWGWEGNSNQLWTRNVSGGTFGSWVKYLHSSNYSSYALPVTGGTLTGDTTLYRSYSPTTGYLYFGNSGARYLGYDGSNYVFNGSHVYSAAGRLWGTSDGTPLFTYGGTMGGQITTPESQGMSYGGSVGTIEVGGAGWNGSWAAMSFHVHGAFACNFGLNANGNFYMGGWSHGATWYNFWTSRDAGQIIQNARMAYAGDPVQTYNVMYEPYGGAVGTGIQYNVFGDLRVANVRLRYRYFQIQLNGGGWATIGYV